MNAAEFWPAVAARLARGEPVFIAIVATATRGSPGTPGARLLLDQDGTTIGTIGGGIMERKLLDEARSRLAAGPASPQLERLVHRKTGSAEDSGLICAGEQHNLTAVLDPATDLAVIQRFCRALSEQNDACTTLYIDANGLHLADEGPEATGGLRLSWSDTDWQYAEESLNRRRMMIVGAGHCGAALAQLAYGIGYHVEVFDTRPDVFDAHEWPPAVASRALASYTDLSQRLHYPELTRVVVMTTAVTGDIEALTALAPMTPLWLGVMGSRAKIRHIRQALATQELADTLIDSIHGPIGLNMKSDTPAEIAVSIMAEQLAQESRRLQP